MPSIASDFTKLAAAGADATAIAAFIGCSAGCGAVLIGATILGFAVSSILEEISDEMNQEARDAKIFAGIAALHARIQANDPTAFLHYSAEAQRTAAEALAQAENLDIKDIHPDDKRRPYFIFHRLLKQSTDGIQTSIRGLAEKLDIHAMHADAMGAQLVEIWTGMQLVSQNNAMLLELLGRIPKPPAPPAASTAEHRKRFLALCEKIHGPANLEAFFRDSNTITHGRITIGHLFVEPDLFVHPHLMSFAPDTVYERSTSFIDLKRIAKFPRRNTTGQNSEADELQRHRTQPDDPRKPALATIAEHQHLVILGDPGAGKTTLLQQHFLALLAKWADSPERHPFPIFLRLAFWEREGNGAAFATFTKTYLQTLAESHWEYGISPTHIAAWVRGFRIILLDGVDEVRDPSRRQLALAQLRVRGASYSDNRVIVTSRPSGYTRGSLGGDWQETTIAPLTDTQAREHLEKWEAIFRSFGEAPKDLPGLLPQLLAHPGLASVTRNALFLHLIVFFHRSNMRLPDDRNDFYSYATSVLSDRWQRRRSGDSTTPPIKFLTQLLATVAIHMMRLGLVTVPEPQFRTLINERLIRAGLTEYAAASETDYFIAAARDLIGVIVDKGGDKFGFLHLSFQEFYAADYLLKAREKEYTELAAKHWDDLDWAEVWQLHLSAADGDTDRRELLHDTARANTHPTLDDKLLRCHLTRLKWAGYAGKSRCPLENESVEWAVARICEWGNWSSDCEVCTILTKWERDFDAALRDVLHHKLADSSIFEGYEAIIPALAAHHAGDANLRVTFFAQLEKEDLDIGGAAAKALVALSMREDAQVEGASRPLATRSVAASIDAHGGGTPPLPAQAPLSIKQELLTRFQSGKGDDYERSALAQGLSGLAGADASLKDALRVRFESGKGDEWERYALAQGLSGLAGADVAVKAALLSRFQSENGHNFERSALAQGLSGLAGANAAVKAALLTRFQSGDGEWKERDALAEGLSGLAGADAAIKAALLARFQSGDGQWRERYALAQGLSGLAGADNGIRAVLLNRFKSSSIEPDERGSLAQGLSWLAEKDPEIKKALLLRFQSDGLNGTERHILAHEISKFSDTDTDVQKSMLTRFQSGDGMEYERRALAQGLAPLALRDAGVRSVLIARLKVDTDLHRMSITTATWRVLRVDRLALP